MEIRVEKCQLSFTSPINVDNFWILIENSVKNSLKDRIFFSSQGYLILVFVITVVLFSSQRNISVRQRACKRSSEHRGNIFQELIFFF